MDIDTDGEMFGTLTGTLAMWSSGLLKKVEAGKIPREASINCIGFAIRDLTAALEKIKGAS